MNGYSLGNAYKIKNLSVGMNHKFWIFKRAFFNEWHSEFCGMFLFLHKYKFCIHKSVQRTKLLHF